MLYTINVSQTSEQTCKTNIIISYILCVAQRGYSGDLTYNNWYVWKMEQKLPINCKT